MKYAVLFLLLAGCGGDVFSSSGGDGGSGGDARDETPTESAVDANEGGPSPEAAADGGRDAGQDAPSEGSVCTPFSFTYSCYNTLDSLMVPEPAQYCFGMGPDLNTDPLSQVATPPKCQCIETFTCTCIVAHSTNFPCSQPSCNEGMENGKPVLVLSCP